MATEVSATKQFAQKILDKLEQSKGSKLTKGEITAGITCSSSEWQAAIAHLLALGKVEGEGEKRNKRYKFIRAF